MSVWEGLDPFEKARQWRRADPAIAEEIVKLAKARIIQAREHEEKRLRAEELGAQHARMLEVEQQRHAHQQAMEEYALTKDRQERRFRLANRLWWTQLVGMLIGFVGVAGIVAVTALTASFGNLLPAAVIFTMGSVLTAACGE